MKLVLKSLLGIGVLMCTFFSCEKQQQEEVQLTSKNPLLQEWKGSYGGVPAFDKMQLKDLQGAIEEGMAMKLKELDIIANNPEAPTFENTIVPYEKSGAPLERGIHLLWYLEKQCFFT